MSYGFQLKNKDSALQSYKIFWKNLVELQGTISKSSKNGESNNLIARITHANNIDIWDPADEDHIEVDALLDLQQEFIKKGGKIVRILLGNKEDYSMNDKYQEVAKNMENHGIEVKYLPMNGLDFDFVWVNGVEGQDFVVKWTYRGKKLVYCDNTFANLVQRVEKTLTVNFLSSEAWQK